MGLVFIVILLNIGWEVVLVLAMINFIMLITVTFRVLVFTILFIVSRYLIFNEYGSSFMIFLRLFWLFSLFM